MKTISNFIFAILISIYSLSFIQASEENRKEKTIDIYFDYNDAIVLSPKEVKTIDMIKHVQNTYIKKIYSDYRIVFEMYTKNRKGESIHVFMLKSNEGKEAEIAFNMDKIYKILKIKNRKTREKIEELEKKH